MHCFSCSVSPTSTTNLFFTIGWLVVQEAPMMLIPASEKEAVAAGHVVDAAKEHGQPIMDQAKSVAQDVVDGVKETAAEAAPTRQGSPAPRLVCRQRP